MTEVKEDNARAGIAKESPEYEMLFLNTSTGAEPENSGTSLDMRYWISDTCLSMPLALGTVGYCVRTMHNGILDSSRLFSSGGDSHYVYNGIRPVVYLSSSIKLQYSGANVDGHKVYNIESY